MLFGADTVLAWDHDARLYRFMQEAAASASMGYITDCEYYGGTTHYTWDANGNLLSRTCGTRTETFEYDYQNRLIRKAGSLQPGLVRSGGNGTSFGYDVDGVRNRVIHNATDVTHMVTDKNRPYAQVVVERNSHFLKE